MVAYGDSAVSSQAFWPVRVPLPVLAGNPEEWWFRSSGGVADTGNPRISFLRGTGLVFGRIQIQPGSLQQAARQAYLDLFDFIDNHPAGLSLLRIWNYIPDITAPDTDGVERYRNFNAGRHEAFDQRRGGVVQPPAASGLGLFGGDLTIYFLAGTEPGLPIENPRQVSAYNYPSLYGRRSPTFSRSLLADMDGRRMLFVSGTASIVGHETRHAGDIGLQTDETLRNIQALLAEAAIRYFEPDPARTRLKIYVRHPEQLALIEERVGKAFPDANCLYLHAEICRPDLLVEIEGAFSGT